MKETNQHITLPANEALLILRELEFLLISLRNIGTYYHSMPGTRVDDYRTETTHFIDHHQVTARLATMRRLITEKFDTELGADDMDDIERDQQNLRTWQKPGDCPPAPLKSLEDFTLQGTATGTAQPITLDEITLLATPATLQALGEFFISAAHQMQSDQLEHLHLQDCVAHFCEEKHADIILLNKALLAPRQP